MYIIIIIIFIFLGCYVTRQCGSGLELIAQKWSHSLVEIDLAWTTVTDDLNAAIMAFAEKGSESPLRLIFEKFHGFTKLMCYVK